MAWVRTFRVTPKGVMGVPDQEIQDWITSVCEQNAFVSVNTILIPQMGYIDPRITVIVTKLDDKFIEDSVSNKSNEDK
jgi:hypothetical protein